MRKVMMKVYKLDELPENIQGKILDEWRFDDQWHWFHEWNESLKMFAHCTGLHISDFSIDYGKAWVKLNVVHHPEFTDLETDLVGLRLRTWLINNWLPEFKKGRYYGKKSIKYSRFYFTYTDYPLTGYCGDYELIKPILDFIKKPNLHWNLRDLLDDIEYKFSCSVFSDYEYWHSEECIREEIHINGHEFTENGDLY